MNFVLILAVIDGFIKQDPTYGNLNVIIFGVPVVIYLIITKWEDLLVPKIPIDAWVTDVNNIEKMANNKIDIFPCCSCEIIF